MKTICRLLVCVYIVATAGVSLDASVTFGSRDSAFNIRSGARFNVTSSNLAISDGTLKLEEGAEVSGNPITFSNGMLDSDGLEALLDGSFDPTGDDYVRLAGSGRFRAEPGTLLHGLSVEGTGNRIEGQPLFDHVITLSNGGTSLTMALQNKLNQNLVLNGGQVVLDDDLALVDDVKLTGSGRVNLNNRELRLGSMYSQPWSNSLYFNNAVDLALSGSVDLTGTWTFGGTSVINGHGCVLDMRHGGQLIVDNNATLFLNDIHITGLGDTAGKIVMRNGNSAVRVSNGTFKLNDNVTTDQGTFYVYGPSTFQLGPENWTFNGNSNLTVDGTTLWLDFLDSPGNPGCVYAPLPLFDGHVWNGPNLITDLGPAGNLDLVNRGTIKESVDAFTMNFDPIDLILLGGNVSGLFSLNHCLYVGSNDTIRITGDTTIDGRGSCIKFNGARRPQLTIMPGVTLTIKNLFFLNINDIVMDLRAGSKILIQENVYWELDEDITFSSNLPAGSAQATIQVADVAPLGNVFTIRGETCRRTFNIHPMLYPGDSTMGGAPRKIFDLGHNSIQLESASIAGLDYINFTTNEAIQALISLSGDSSVDIHSTFEDGLGDFGTTMNFFVEGINNDLILRKDGTVLGGNIAFGDYPDNELNIRFNLAEQFNIANEDSKARQIYNIPTDQNGVQPGWPFVVLTGDPGILLASEDGIAHLSFPDYNAVVANDNTNAFAVEDNSILSFNRLQLIKNPIKQGSLLFRFDGVERIGEKIDPSFVRSPFRGSGKRVVDSAVTLRRKFEKEMYLEAIKHSFMASSKPSNKQKAKAVKKVQPKHRGVSLLPEDDALLRLYRSKRFVKGLNLPDEFDQSFTDKVYKPNKNAAINGFLDFQRSTIEDFRVDPNLPFNIRIRENSTIILGADVVLNSNHVINIQGTGNVIQLTKNMQIGPNNIYFAEGAEVTFLFPPQTENITQLVIGDGTTLDLEPNAKMIMSGAGNVLVGDSVTINFKGIKTVQPVTKVATITSRPHFIVTDHAFMSVLADSAMRFKGVGHIEISSHGKINMTEANSLMIMGLDTATVDDVLGGTLAEDANDIIWDVINKGNVNLQLPTTATTDEHATISLRCLASTLNFENGAKFAIDNQGIFQVNCITPLLGGSPLKPGMVQSWSLVNSTLLVHGSGTMALGSNKYNPAIAGPFPFAYDALAASIEGGTSPGLIEFVDTTAKTFTGRLNITSAARERNDNQTSLELVRDLININPSLLVSTLFTDANGSTIIRTVNGNQVTLGATDVISGDTSTGYISGYDAATGQRFSIDPNGNRTNA